MATLGPNYISGITTSVNPTDVAFKQYADNKPGVSIPTDELNNGKLLFSDGSNVSWEKASNYVEYTSAGNYNFSIPTRAQKLTIEVSGSGGGGNAGNINSSEYIVGSIWSHRTTPYQYYDVYDSSYDESFGYIAAVGTSGRIYHSTDTIEWTYRTSGVTNSLYSTIWAEGNYTIGGSSGVMISSTDSIHWYLKTSGTTANIVILRYINGQYMYGGSSKSFAVSTDTVHWEVRTVSGSTYELSGIEYDGSDYIITTTNSRNYHTSTDTIHWVQNTNIPSSQNDNESMTYSSDSNLLVIGGQYGGLVTTTDKIVWSIRTVGMFSGTGGNKEIDSLLYVEEEGIYFAGGYGKLANSTDTIHWTVRSTFTGNYNIFNLRYLNGNIIATGQYTNQIIVSYGKRNTKSFSGSGGNSGAYGLFDIQSDYVTDATLNITVGAGGRGGGQIRSDSWTLRTLGYTSGVNNSITYGNDLFLIVGGDGVVGPKILASTDSIIWSLRTLGYSSIELNSVRYIHDNQQFMTVANDGDLVAGSTDSIHWTARTTPNPLTNFYRDINYAKNCGYIAVGSGRQTVTSTDSIHWIRRTSGTASSIINTIFEDLYGNVIVGDISGGISISTDGISWTRRTSGTTQQIDKIYYSLKNYFAIAGTDQIIASTDSIHWAKRTTGSTQSFAGILTRNNTFIASGGLGEIITSTDSVVWTLRSSNSSVDLYDITYGKDIYVCFGDSSNVTTLDVSPEDGEDTTISWNGSAGSHSFTISGGKANLYNRIIQQSAPAPGLLSNYKIASGGSLGATPAIRSIGDKAPPANSRGPSGGGSGSDYSGSGGNGGDVTYTSNILAISNIDNNGNDASDFGFAFGHGGNGGGVTNLTGTVKLTSWEARTTQTNFNNVNRVIDFIDYQDGNYIYGAGASGYNIFAVSTDTIVWTKRTLSINITNAFGDIPYRPYGYGNGYYIIGTNYGGATELAASTDTITWTARVTGLSGSLQAVGYGNGYYVSALSGGSIIASTDTVTWISRTSGNTSSSTYKVKYLNGEFISVGTNDYFNVSTDTIHWIKRTVGNPSGSYYDIIYNGNYYLSGNTGLIAVSTDTIHWSLRTFVNTGNIYNLLYADNVYYAGSTTGWLTSSTDSIIWTNYYYFGAQPQNFLYENGIYVFSQGFYLYSTQGGKNIVGNGGDGIKGGGGGGGASSKELNNSGYGGSGGNSYVRISWV